MKMDDSWQQNGRRVITSSHQSSTSTGNTKAEECSFRLRNCCCMHTFKVTSHLPGIYIQVPHTKQPLSNIRSEADPVKYDLIYKLLGSLDKHISYTISRVFRHQASVSLYM